MPEETKKPSMEDVMREQLALASKRDAGITEDKPETTPEPPKVGTPKEEPKAQDLSTDKQEEAPVIEEPEIEVNLGFNSENKPKEEARGKDFDEDEFNKEFPDLEGDEDPKKGEKYQKLKAELKKFKKGEAETAKERETKAELQRLQDELNEIKEKASKVDDYEKLLEEFRESDYRLAVEKSKEYQDGFTTPVKNISDGIDKLAADLGIDAYQIQDAVIEGNVKKRVEMINALMPDETEDGESNAAYKNLLYTEINSMNKAHANAIAEQARLMANAKENAEKSQAKRQQEAKAQQEQRQKLYRSEIDNQMSEVRKLKLSEDSMKAIESAVSLAKSMDLPNEIVGNQAYAATAGAVLPTLIKEIQSLRGQLAKATAQKGQQQKASVNLSEGEGNTNTPTPKKKTATEMLFEAASRVR